MRMNAIIPEKNVFPSPPEKYSPVRPRVIINSHTVTRVLRNLISLVGCILMSISSRSVALAKSDFIPWNAEVRVADENLPGAIRHVPRETHVHNGPQGGAWLLIRFFQVAISPQDGPSCGFTPVCSLYGRRAVERHGAVMGLFLAFDRVLRCNPFNAPGADPVPQRILGP